MHHGTQPQYLNKNFSISLSFWDRVFGTYVEEDEPPKYGLTNGFATNSPFRANWQPWVDYLTKSRRTYTAPALKARSLSQRAYLFCQLVAVLFCASTVESQTDTALTVLLVGAVLGSLGVFDGLVRQSRAAFYVEGFRVALLMPTVIFLTRNETWSGNSFWWICGAAVFSLLWLWAAFRRAKRDRTIASKARRFPPANAA